jgi:hypothetical protein
MTTKTNVKASFSIQPFDGAYTVTPTIDGVALTELVIAFERQQHFYPSGSYRGIVPARFKYGPLDRYFLADFQDDSYFIGIGGVYFLGCDCGEVGCWPLQGTIRVDGSFVIWKNFRQPHRTQWDYSGFGPFVFALEQYREAVSAFCKEYAALVPGDE